MKDRPLTAKLLSLRRSHKKDTGLDLLHTCSFASFRPYGKMVKSSKTMWQPYIKGRMRWMGNQMAQIAKHRQSCFYLPTILHNFPR